MGESDGSRHDDLASAAELPLAGLTVVELGHSVAAPYAGLVLAEMGAEVIKVERPGTGDDARAWGPPFVDGMSAVFHALNRHKKSVTADLKSAEGVETVRRLARSADVFIQNLKPGLANEVGLGADVLCAENPGLIYSSIHAFGAAGPLAARPGYDPLMQAFGGIMASQGEPGRPSVRVGTSIVDMGTGMWVVMGVLAALLRRKDTGKGGVVDTSLFETALGWMVYMLPMFEMSGRPPAKSGSGTAMISPYQAFRTKDGELVIAAGNDNLFRKMCDVLDAPGWAQDPRFASNGLRVENKTDLVELIEARTKARPAAEWAALLDAAGVPNAPVQTIDQVAAHSQTESLGILRQSPADGRRYFGLPVSFEGVRPGRNEPAPALGQHNATAAKEETDQPRKRANE